MNTGIRRTITLLMCLLTLLSLIPPCNVHAAEASPAPAQDITATVQIPAFTGFEDTHYLFDGEAYTRTVSNADHAALTIEAAEGIGSLYISFITEYGAYTLTDNTTGATYTCGEDRYLHEFIDVAAIFGAASTSVTLSFDNGVVGILEITVYTAGEVPDTVQKWSQPVEDRTDLILFPTHGDDEQLFFAGILPYYAVEKGFQVQVVYLTDHRDVSPNRVHEMLNGLWAVGIRTYPVLGPFPDFYTTKRSEAYNIFATRGYRKDDLTEWVVEQLRRFKPLVVVGHDFNGEYGHGQHMVYADVLAAAVEISNDASQYPESAEAYGTWDVPKTYIHLYRQNQIYMDWDQPMENFDGMTPFQVTKYLGFACHKSQQAGFNWWIKPYETAASIPSFSPCLYGLYRSTVGEDVEKNDFFENIVTYTEQDRIAAEEEARRRAEEQRKEEERLAAEAEARRQEEERLAAEEAARQEEARKQAELEAAMAQEAAQRRNKTIAICAAVVVILGITVLCLSLRRRKKAK